MTSITKRKTFNYAVTGMVSLAFFAFLLLFNLIRDSADSAWNESFFVPLVFALILFTASIVFSFSPVAEPKTVMLFAAIVCFALVLRIVYFDYASNDYNAFLLSWVSQLHDAPGFSGLSANIGDYNMPYLYLLLPISKIPITSLYTIKLISIAFDLILAFFVMKVISLKFPSAIIQLAAFGIALLLPTVILNGGCWAQCDAIYAAFILAFFYYCLKDMPVLGVIMLGIAFSFKLQTIFIIPILIIFLFKKKIKLWHSVIFISTFFVLLVPALLAGKPFYDTISIYVKQTGQYPNLQMNAPSVFQFVGSGADFGTFNLLGIIVAAIAVIALLLLAYYYKDRLNQKDFITFALLFTLTIPFLLPRMHDRYFFVAEIFALIFAFYNPRRFYIPIIVTFASLVSYTYYLMNGFLIIDQKFTAASLFLAIALVLYHFIAEKRKEVSADTANQVQPQIQSDD